MLDHASTLPEPPPREFAHSTMGARSNIDVASIATDSRRVTGVLPVFSANQMTSSAAPKHTIPYHRLPNHAPGGWVSAAADGGALPPGGCSRGIGFAGGPVALEPSGGAACLSRSFSLARSTGTVDIFSAVSSVSGSGACRAADAAAGGSDVAAEL